MFQDNLWVHHDPWRILLKCVGLCLCFMYFSFELFSRKWPHRICLFKKWQLFWHMSITKGFIKMALLVNSVPDGPLLLFWQENTGYWHLLDKNSGTHWKCLIMLLEQHFTEVNYNIHFGCHTKVKDGSCHPI
jgi:hypothetical protein